MQLPAPTQSTAAFCAAFSTAAVTAALFIVQRRERRRLQADIEKLRGLREMERTGRIRAEQRLRGGGDPADIAAGVPGCKPGRRGPGNEMDVAMAESLELRPIGIFSSCYRARCGTPRQGGVVQDSRAVLHCSRHLNPQAALLGIEGFSHCWVLYGFHENTNGNKEAQLVAARKQRQGFVPHWQGICMKVVPPRCPSLRVGVLACRTPHRPNPIGLSLAKIEAVNAAAGELVLGGLDVIDGTPCYDIKPYLPAFEAIPSASVPQWVHKSYEEPRMQVTWSPDAAATFDALAAEPGKLKAEPFASHSELRVALEGTLSLDIRSPLQQERHPTTTSGGPFFTGDLWFHELHVTYTLRPAPGQVPAIAVEIQHIEMRTRGAED
mmetsp:Transcript_110925/g.312718  ORF Transcript_110925/g.312718 Transcript_110925/m.312718 type:complete len:380 (-) Transcript_110925:121-1260(-)